MDMVTAHRMEGRKFVELFDTIAYVVAKDADLDFLLFSRILQTEKVIHLLLL